MILVAQYLGYGEPMAIDPQAAFDKLMSALEAFHYVATTVKDPESPEFIRASDRLADAYIIYDDLLLTRFGVEAPFDTFSDDYEEYDEDDFDDEYDGEDFDDLEEDDDLDDEDDFDDELDDEDDLDFDDED